jgi:hypothetical protein
VTTGEALVALDARPVERALGFYRQVGASAYLHEAEALLAVAASP